jgi:hypothetical protein
LVEKPSIAKEELGENPSPEKPDALDTPVAAPCDTPADMLGPPSTDICAYFKTFLHN